MSQALVANGVNGSDGRYLLPSLAAADVARAAMARSSASSDVLYADQRSRRPSAGVREGLDPKDLAQVGWGLVLPAESSAETAEILEALAPLIELRREQASSKDETYFQIYEGERGYRPGESKQGFLRRHRTGSGPADPRQMPYYLLLVATPEEIPFWVQSQLDVQRAIGRIAFDRPGDHAHYAATVVAAEKGSNSGPPRAAFFGPRNADDDATDLSAAHLLRPLAAWATRDQPKWQVESSIGEEATKNRLRGILADGNAPELLFTASHGMGFDATDPRQRSDQGALLCQDWPGPVWHDGPIPEDFYFAGRDVPSTGSLNGMIACHFACFSLGTPQRDEFDFIGGAEPLAPAPFLSGLPQRLLARPDGALAVIGHVERAWGYSFYEDEAGRQLAAFEDMLKRLMEGHPIGSAFEPMNQRYAELSTDLNVELDDLRNGKNPDDDLLACLWTANNDARNYAILGDPAVRAASPAAAEA